MQQEVIMIINSLQTLFKRDLNQLKIEIESYQNEKTLWEISQDINNSAGNLCLHLLGNLNTYIGSELGNTGYVRYRDLEFSSKNIPRLQLIKMIDETMEMIGTVLESLSENDLRKDYPIIVFENKMTTEFFLIHLISHLDYHLGQINYHRRLLDQRL